MAVALSFIGMLLMVCVSGPFVVTNIFGPGWGVFAAGVALVPWRYCGPRPSPGFLDGTVCVGGWLAILASLVCQVIALARS